MTQYPLGEQQSETDRLKAQNRYLPVDERALWAGLRPGMRVVDAGCGPGETSRALARLVGPEGRVDAFDASEARLEAARATPAEPGSAPLRFVQGDLFAPPYERGTYDFVFCQFVLEYVARAPEAVVQLASLLRPGGVLCLVDVDPVGYVIHPQPSAITQGRARLEAIMAAGGFDVTSGRKLFSWAVGAGLERCDAFVQPQCYAGAAPAEDVENWRTRLAALRQVAAAPFGGIDAWDAFVDGYLGLLADAGSFKLANIVTVRGSR